MNESRGARAVEACHLCGRPTDDPVWWRFGNGRLTWLKPVCRECGSSGPNPKPAHMNSKGEPSA